MDNTILHTKVSLYDFFFANKVRKTYTNAAVSILLIIILLVFALRPTILKIGEIKQKITLYRQYNAKVEQKVAAAKTLSDQLNNSSSVSTEGLKDQIEFMNKVYFTRVNLELLYKNIYERAKAEKIGILSIAPNVKDNDPTSGATDSTATTTLSSNAVDVGFVFETTDLTAVQRFTDSLQRYNAFPIFSKINTIKIGEPLKDDQGAVTKYRNVNVSFTIFIDNTRPQV